MIGLCRHTFKVIKKIILIPFTQTLCTCKVRHCIRLLACVPETGKDSTNYPFTPHARRTHARTHARSRINARKHILIALTVNKSRYNCVFHLIYLSACRSMGRSVVDVSLFSLCILIKLLLVLPFLMLRLSNLLFIT